MPLNLSWSKACDEASRIIFLYFLKSDLPSNLRILNNLGEVKCFSFVISENNSSSLVPINKISGPSYCLRYAPVVVFPFITVMPK